MSEWNDTIIPVGDGFSRGVRGGCWTCGAGELAASVRPTGSLTQESDNRGFRVAMIPEPGTGLLLMMGLLSLARWHRPNA